MLNQEIDVANIMKTIKKSVMDENNLNYKNDLSVTDKWLLNVINERTSKIKNMQASLGQRPMPGTTIPGFSTSGVVMRKIKHIFAKVFIKFAKLITIDQNARNIANSNVLDNLTDCIQILAEDLNELKKVTNKVNSLEQSLTAEISSSRQSLTNEISDLRQSLTAEIGSSRQSLTAEISSLKQSSKRVDVFLDNLKDKIDDILIQLDENDNRIREKADFATVKTGLFTLKELYINLQSESKEMSSKLNEANARFNYYLKNRLSSNISLSTNEIEENIVAQIEEEVYYDFESRFRGSQTDIELSQKFYLNYIQGLSPTDIIIDIGCGRGEWLKLLTQEGYSPLGIDLNKRMIDECKYNGLNAYECDALKYLSTLEDNSVSLLTSFQVVEHLEYSQINKLIYECYRVLKKDGIVIFETPNPCNLLVGACNFYIDPTHKKPLHPLLLSFYFENKGFIAPKVVYPKIEKFQDWWDSVERLDHGLVRLARLDAIVNEVNKNLNASSDYAIIASKG